MPGRKETCPRVMLDLFCETPASSCTYRRRLRSMRLPSSRAMAPVRAWGGPDSMVSPKYFVEVTLAYNQISEAHTRLNISTLELGYFPLFSLLQDHEQTVSLCT